MELSIENKTKHNKEMQNNFFTIFDFVLFDTISHHIINKCHK